MCNYFVSMWVIGELYYIKSQKVLLLWSLRSSCSHLINMCATCNKRAWVCIAISYIAIKGPKGTYQYAWSFTINLLSCYSQIIQIMMHYLDTFNGNVEIGLSISVFHSRKKLNNVMVIWHEYNHPTTQAHSTKHVFIASYNNYKADLTKIIRMLLLYWNITKSITSHLHMKTRNEMQLT